MRSFTTLVVTATCLFFIGELGAKYLLVEVGGMDGNNEPLSRDSIIDSDSGSRSVKRESGEPGVPGRSKTGKIF